MNSCFFIHRIELSELRATQFVMWINFIRRIASYPPDSDLSTLRTTGPRTLHPLNQEFPWQPRSQGLFLKLGGRELWYSGMVLCGGSSMWRAAPGIFVVASHLPPSPSPKSEFLSACFTNIFTRSDIREFKMLGRRRRLKSDINSII